MEVGRGQGRPRRGQFHGARGLPPPSSDRWTSQGEKRLGEKVLELRSGFQGPGGSKGEETMFKETYRR